MWLRLILIFMNQSYVVMNQRTYRITKGNSIETSFSLSSRSPLGWVTSLWFLKSKLLGKKGLSSHLRHWYLFSHFPLSWCSLSPAKLKNLSAQNWHTIWQLFKQVLRDWWVIRFCFAAKDLSHGWSQRKGLLYLWTVFRCIGSLSLSPTSSPHLGQYTCA